MHSWRSLFHPRHLLLAFLALAIALFLPLYSPPSLLTAQALIPPQADMDGRTAYQSGRFHEAVELFQQALAFYDAQNDDLREAMVWSNLALAQQQLGNWPEANRAIATSLRLLESLEEGRDRLAVDTQVLTIAGQLSLGQGQAEQALHHWEQADVRYRELGDRSGQWQSQIYQAQALQTLGFYRRAIDVLEGVNQALHGEPDSLLKVAGLQGLGEALRMSGDLERSRQVLAEGVAIARTLDRPDTVATLNLSLATTLQALGEIDAALALYQDVASQPTASGLQARLSQLALLVQQESWIEAQEIARSLEEPIRTLRPSRDNIYTRIRYATTVLALVNHGAQTGVGFSLRQLGEGLAIAAQQAQALGDRRAESSALGSLGHVYEQTNQWGEAEAITRRGLALAQGANADDLTYRWQWQLGRVLREQGNRGEAIAAYEQAVQILQQMRTDLVAINPEVQFTFRQSIEPIHRELVSLLLLTDSSAESSSNHLERARQVIESLQQAELENFFREACLDAQSVAIDQIDSQAAIFYPVLLPDRLEVIVRLPDRPLQHYALPVTADEVTDIVQRLRLQFVNQISRTNQMLPLAQQVYDWLIRPVATDLQASGAETLVFVLDGALRNVPMGALHDGERFLIEQYSIALTPGLQLLAPQPLEVRELRLIAAGLTEARQGFNPLPGVGHELEQIKQEVPSQVLLNQAFTRDSLQQAIANNPAPVVHLATHGQFSSNLEETFILTWGDRIDIRQLSTLLQGTDINRRNPIELLVMSACQTASGDPRATLGLAGIAVQAGARSTLASLWSVDDQATSELMVHFYHELATGRVTKTEALRRAQLEILQKPIYRRHPYYWAPFVLLGNWL